MDKSDPEDIKKIKSDEQETFKKGVGAFIKRSVK